MQYHINEHSKKMKYDNFDQLVPHIVCLRDASKLLAPVLNLDACISDHWFGDCKDPREHEFNSPISISVSASLLSYCTTRLLLVRALRVMPVFHVAVS